SLTSVGNAAGSVRAGMDKVVLAGGVQSSSTAPQMRRRVLGTADEYVEGWAPPSHPDSPEAPNRNMPITVGWNTARIAGIGREEMDAWALRSHQRALAAIDAGRLAGEITPIQAPQRDGTVKTFQVDEGPRRDASAEKMAS